MFAIVCSTYHNTELQSFSATSKGSKEGALLSSTLVSIPVSEQLATGIVALRGGQLPMHMVLCHHVMVAINGAEHQGDRRQGLGAARLAVTERVQSGTRRCKVPYSAPKREMERHCCYCVPVVRCRATGELQMFTGSHGAVSSLLHMT